MMRDYLKNNDISIKDGTDVKRPHPLWCVYVLYAEIKGFDVILATENR